jgi:RsiW-degrading membrane proteinase PrsW (M82 family)
MNNNIIIFCGILPAILLVFYIYLRDRYQREPLGQILKAVLFGVISAGIAIVLESTEQSVGLLIPEPATWIGALWNAFVGAAMPEELAKLIMLWLLLRRNKYFDERFDGIVYACCIGMGFAGTENVLYLFGNIENWQSVAVSRAIFAVPGHFMFAVAMGYFYSKIHFRDMSWSYRSLVFVAPVILHGTYDGLLFMANVTPEVAGLILMGFYLFCFWMFRVSRRSIQAQSKASDPNNLIFRNL